MADGLKIDDYLSWIDKTIEFDDFMKTIYSELVIGTPAYGVSKKGKNLIDYYGFRNIDDYPNLFNELFKNISDFKSFDTLEKLKNGLSNHNLLSFKEYIPSNLQECVYMYTGKPTDNKFYKECVKKYIKNMGSTKKEVEVKKYISDIDKFFSHIRNCFAHGSYATVEENNNTFFILQDDNKKFISARMILKKSTIEDIITYLNKRRARNEHTNQ